jgi:hypothetical protein
MTAQRDTRSSSEEELAQPRSVHTIKSRTVSLKSNETACFDHVARIYRIITAAGKWFDELGNR